MIELSKSLVGNDTIQGRISVFTLIVIITGVGLGVFNFTLAMHIAKKRPLGIQHPSVEVLERRDGYS